MIRMSIGRLNGGRAYWPSPPWFWLSPVVYPFQQVGHPIPKPGHTSVSVQRALFTKVWMANPITPIILVFQRAIYARLDNKSTHTQLLPHWPYLGYVAYLGMSVAFGLIVLTIAVRVFGRSEANFAEEL